MKKLSDVMHDIPARTKENNGAQFNFYEELRPIDEHTAQFINYIFERLAGIIPSFKYSADCISTLDSIRREYTYEIVKNNIRSSKQVNAALERIRAKGLTYLPSPSAFVGFCKPTPEDINAPSLDKAYDEAIKNAYPDGTTKKWSHEAVKHAYHKADPFFLRSEPAVKTKPVFEKAYLQACEECADGRNLNQIEAPQDYQFTDTELHWIFCFKKIIEDGLPDTFFPSDELREKGRELYFKWLKSGANNA